ncbi:MAG TPA: SRPBCC domain-containing protein [Acidimicrobiia bacterium]|nr:SRPBCC domain-containing protein [Acidimicrobiia bacterium]
MHSYEAGAMIAAPLEAVWAVLTDGAAYGQWDSGVEEVQGTIAPGEKITLRSQAVPGRAFPVRVAFTEPGRVMTWTGGMPLGLFRGVRVFRLAPDGEGTTFTMREEFTGPLLKMIWKRMPDLGPSFVQFAEGLKARAEDGE